jgi:3-phenylpropionate/trans-cinnamate dioxygenase ferredoxin reductase subunit
MNDKRRIVIVGAGHGGGTAAAILRQQGFAGEVILFGSEPVGPYHRPPLSKSLLKGELEQPLLPKDFYREQRIELRISTPVVAIDREADRVQLRDGELVPYDILILATGAKARRLAIPGIELERVYELRTITQARILYDVLSPSSRLAIVGGGWIGLEVAASARAADIDVTVIEREDRLLARVASPELSRFLTGYHSERGTKILTSAGVSALRPGGNQRIVGSVVLDDGREIESDRVLVGVGAVAEDELASAAGLPCQDGVIVDSNARTADPRIYAVGDMTRRPLDFYDGLFRLESIPSAVEQARRAVASIVGKPAPAPEVPWFWSDQFDLKLQIAGLLLDADASVVRGNGTGGRLAVFHLRDGRLVAMEGVNAPAEFMACKHLIRDQVKLDLERLADASVPLPDTHVVEPATATAPDRSPPETLEPSAPDALEPEAPGLDQPDLPGPGGKPGEPRATFVQADGEIFSVDVPEGMTLMEGSVRNNLPGIIAECGGTCSCGTCHVYVDPQWSDRLDEPEFEEEDLLEFIDGRQESSRLSCQIVMTDELDGLVVRVPDVDY